MQFVEQQPGDRFPVPTEAPRRLADNPEVEVVAWQATT